MAKDELVDDPPVDDVTDMFGEEPLAEVEESDTGKTGEDAGEGGEGGEGGEDDAPPDSLYVSLVEKYGEERAAAEYLRLEGVKDEEAESKTAPVKAEAEDVAEEVPDDVNERWQFTEMARTVTEEAEVVDAELSGLANTINGLVQRQDRVYKELESLQTESDNLFNQIRQGEIPDDRLDQTWHRLRIIGTDISRKTADMEKIVSDHGVKMDAYNATTGKKQTVDAKVKAVKVAEQNMAAYPVLAQNRTIYTRLMIEGKIPRGTSFPDVLAMISAERIKAGGKPISTPGAQSAKKPATQTKPGTKPVNPAALKSWPAVLKKLNAPRGVGNGGGSTGAAAKSRKAVDPGAPFERDNPQLAKELREMHAESLQKLGKKKGK